MYLYTAQEMRDLDRYTIEEIGIPGVVLMENAGNAVARVLLDRFSERKSVLVLAGSGNNGGDGLVAARRLVAADWDVFVWFVGNEDKMSRDTRTFYAACRRSGVRIEPYSDTRREELVRDLEETDIVVDALLGTGIRGPLRPPVQDIIRLVNDKHRGFTVAVDVPSGVDTDTGAVLPEAVRADVTVTFAYPKWCHYLHPAAEHCGELILADIGIPPTVTASSPPPARVNDPRWWRDHLKPRSPWSHKGTYGHLMVVGGSRGMLGAAVMAGTAGLRTGAGLVTIAVPERQEQPLAAQVMQAMVRGLPDDGTGRFAPQAARTLTEGMERFSAVAVGPGLGRFAGEIEWLKEVLTRTPLPLVLDADALNILAADPKILLARNRETVLTPHPGEMARLLGCSTAEVESSRHCVAREWAKQYGVTVVLKGPRTVMAFPDGTQMVNPTGSSALAKAGSGDILTGMLGALLARGIPVHAAVPMGVYLHGLAGEMAVSSSEHSVVADDVLSKIGDAIHQVS